MKLICKFLEEIVILSDGRISTCCMDPLGENAYSSIHDSDFGALKEKYHNVFKQIMENPDSMPKCARCFASLKENPTEGGNRYILFPDEDEVQKGIEENSEGPTRAVIELSSICNLKCRGCMQYRADIPGTRKESLMDIDRLKEWIKDGSETIRSIRLYNYGETFVHPRAIEFIEFIKELGLFVEIATNGLLLDTEEKQRRVMASGVDRLMFSIHGSSQETVEPYMTEKFDFEKMMEILKSLSRLRKELGTKVQMYWKYLLFEWNDTDEDMARAEVLARATGMDKLLFTLPGYPSPSKRFEGPHNRNVKVVDFD